MEEESKFYKERFTTKINDCVDLIKQSIILDRYDIVDESAALLKWYSEQLLYWSNQQSEETKTR